MSEMKFENKLRSIAKGMDYPPTPDIAGSVMTRLRKSPSHFGRGERGEGRPRFTLNRFTWSLTIILVLLSSLMLVPTVRAAVIEFIQIGVVRIFPQSVEPTVESPRAATPAALTPVTTASSSQAANLIPILDQMAGRTTLVEAQDKVEFSILLPTYPADLGRPDYVYVQNVEGNMVILVWLDPQQSDKVLMSLHFIPNGSWAIKKVEPDVIEETKIDGNRAIWTTGPYPLIFSNGDIQFERLVSGHVLIWTDLDVTYRLETDLSLEEAVRIAESLEPIP